MCIIRKRGADRIRRGHLWVYRSDIINTGDAKPGGIVTVRDERDNTLGMAFYSSRFAYVRAAPQKSTPLFSDAASIKPTICGNASASIPF